MSGHVINIKVSIFTIICISLLYLATFTESKTVRVRAVKQKIHNPESPNLLHRKNLKIINRPAISPKPTKELSAQFGYNLKRKENEASEIVLQQSATEGDIIESTFSSGFKRFFETLGYLFLSSEENPQTEVKPPGFFPTTNPFYFYDFSSLLRLIENMDSSQIEQLTESAFVDTLSQLIGIIGVSDLRDWLGFILMYFILGPCTVPLFWLPVSFLIMVGLLTPLFYFNPPSKLNIDSLGHDPIHPEAAERSIQLFESGKSIDINGALNSNQTVTSSSPSVVESCLDRVTCQVARFYRDNPVTKWIVSHFNATKVEWARMLREQSTPRHRVITLGEDCDKYTCPIVPSSVRKFVSMWTS